MSIRIKLVASWNKLSPLAVIVLACRAVGRNVLWSVLDSVAIVYFKWVAGRK